MWLLDDWSLIMNSLLEGKLVAPNKTLFRIIQPTGPIKKTNTGSDILFLNTAFFDKFDLGVPLFRKICILE